MYIMGWDPANSIKHKGDSEYKLNQHVWYKNSSLLDLTSLWCFIDHVICRTSLGYIRAQ